uniref:PE family protein n=2 Tax=Mycobacterium riyadhense TaxID=486698 RepID=A0A653EDP2_9MYCO|nr:PE family protein [Mycobacterium riyadhense]
MRYVTVAPEAVMAAASDLANLGSTIREATAAAAAPTTSVVAAAQDEVSTAIAALFGGHAQQFQALSAKAVAFHDQFVQALTGGAASYVKAEAANLLRLMVGDHAGAFGAAALSNAAAAAPAADIGGELLGRLFGAGFKAFETAVESLARIAGQQADGAVQTARLAKLAMQTKQIVTNGVKLIAQDGAELYTNGQELVQFGGRFPGLYGREAVLNISNDAQWLRNVWGVDQQTLRSLLGSQLHVFARGEGLAQSYFQKVGNDIYQIETNAQGQIIRSFVTTEAIFKRWVAMTVNGARSTVFPRL